MRPAFLLRFSKPANDTAHARHRAAKDRPPRAPRRTTNDSLTMYFAVVISSMVVLPALSIFFEAFLGAAALDLALVATWLVFWGVGARLFVAGARQIIWPSLTAELLGLCSEGSSVIIRELGFANFALGIAGLASLAAPGWRPAVAMAGGLFLSLAGIHHALQPRKSPRVWLAMVTDLMVGITLLGTLIRA
jgi:hypothetical protein